MKLKLSELFYSLQGEGRYVGIPSIFMRTFGCNFTCGGFGMPRGEKSQERFTIDPKQFTKYSDLPLVKTGCDSYASWDPRFKHLSKHYEVEEIAKMMADLLPQGSFLTNHYQDIHLVITGGEPLLGWQKAYPVLLDHLYDSRNLNYVTFETNGTQPLTEDFANWMTGSQLQFTFSISPKLSASGESWEDAFQPGAVRSYEEVLQAICKDRIRSDYDEYEALYLKFVVDKVQDLKEVEKAVTAYQNVGIFRPVYIMPVGGTTEGYNENNTAVAKMALEKGWRYSPRLQVDLWKNAWGT